MRGDRVVAGPFTKDRWNEDCTLEQARLAWYPDARLMTRIVVTTFEVSDWEPA